MAVAIDSNKSYTSTIPSGLGVSETYADLAEEATILGHRFQPEQPRSEADTLLEFEYMNAQELTQDLLISKFAALG
jgi:hypothetical protein